jgi:CubicO group peptidase (beta-lactamase class C family)
MRNAERMFGFAALTFGVSLLVKFTRTKQRLNEIWRRPDQTSFLLTEAARDSIRARGADAVGELTTWLLARSDVAGLTCAIVKHGKLVWASGFGLGNIERQLRFTENTICPIGSVSAWIGHIQPGLFAPCLRSPSWLAPSLP